MGTVLTNIPGWVKDEDTGVAINTNMTQLEQLKQARRANKEMQQLRDEVKTLKIIVLKLCHQLGIDNV